MLHILQKQFALIVVNGHLEKIFGVRDTFIINDEETYFGVLLDQFQHMLNVFFAFFNRHMVDNIRKIDGTVGNVAQQVGL